jgi:hypothetical protein
MLTLAEVFGPGKVEYPRGGVGHYYICVLLLSVSINSNVSY